MKNKTSLLKTLFSKSTLNGKAEKDEMIIYERNKITHCGFTILTGIMVFCGIIADTLDIILDFKLTSQHILLIIGSVSFGMLVAFCKKGVVNHQFAWVTFLWGVLTLPLAINNVFLDMIVTGKVYAIVSPIVIIVLIFIAYEICNIIYKRSQKED